MSAMRSSALLFLPCIVFGACRAQSASSATELATSRVFAVSDGAVRTTPAGGRSRDILRASLLTGEAIAMHETTQPVGAAPAPLHAINHSEFIVVRQGTVTFAHDGLNETAGAGDILYIARGTMHAVRNTGDTPATYVVIAIGGDVKR